MSISSSTFAGFTPDRNKAAVTCSSGSLTMTDVNFNNLTISTGSQTSDIFLTGVNPVTYNGGYIYHEGIGSVVMNGPGLAGTFSNLYFKSPKERQDQGTAAMIMVQANAAGTFTFKNVTMDGAQSTWGTLNAGTFNMESISIINIPDSQRKTNPGFMYLNNMVVNLSNAVIRNVSTGSGIATTGNVQLNANNLTVTNFTLSAVSFFC